MKFGFASVFLLAVVAGCNDGELALLPRAPVDAGRDASAEVGPAVPVDAADVNAADANAPVCTDGGCGCGLSSCGGTCFDLLNDPRHCGRCDQGCLHNQYCQLGQCQCLPGFSPCNGTCTHLGSNPDHCGTCDRICHTGESCDNGACVAAACSAGHEACPTGDGRTSCADVHTGAYCGHCGVACGPDEICAGGACQRYAPATPCRTCPCTAACLDGVAAPSRCCAGIAGGAQPICVHGDACP